MKKDQMTENPPESDKDQEVLSGAEPVSSGEEAAGVEQAGRASSLEEENRELNNKYLRLYAEFDNYRKRVNREKEEIRKYGNESLLYELLPVLDNLELAIKHGACDPKSGLLQGVENTLKEFTRVLEKFGLKKIESAGQPFDPAVHHAMAQVEREDLEDKMVAEEMRPGYLYNEKVLRPSLVAVSKRPHTKTDRVQENGSTTQDNKAKQNIEEE